VTNFEFSETEFSDGQTITVTIQENNNPTGCKLDINVIFSNCTITVIDNEQWPNPQNQYTFPYNFGGVLENITTFSFRLEWCGSQGTFPGFCVNADYNGIWVDIDPNNLVETGLLLSVLNQYPAADTLNYNETIFNPQYNSFTAIQNYLNLPGVQEGFIRMRFRAQNSAGCVVPHTRTVNLSSPAQQPQIFTLIIPYNNVLEAACCNGPYTQTVHTYATSTYQLLHTNTGLLPNPPAIFADAGLTTYAPAGWYTDGEIARRWNGPYGFWGGAINTPPGNQETEYIVCSYNTQVIINSCP